MRKRSIGFPLSTLLFALSFSSAMLLALCGSVDAQQSGKIFRIGFLAASTASGNAGLLEIFRQEMHKLGWIEGKNIAFEYRYGEQKPERLPELARDLARLKVDLILVVATPAALAAKRATTNSTRRARAGESGHQMILDLGSKRADGMLSYEADR